MSDLSFFKFRQNKYRLIGVRGYISKNIESTKNRIDFKNLLYAEFSVVYTVEYTGSGYRFRIQIQDTGSGYRFRI